MNTSHFSGVLLLTAVLSAGTLGLSSCDKDKVAAPKPSAPSKQEKPDLRLYAIAGAAAAVEPCGCVADMLGGVDHAAAYVERSKGEASAHLVVGAGPMFFENPTLGDEAKSQALFKAEAMATSLSELELTAWSPGANDWAAGRAELKRLHDMTQARLLAANLDPKVGPVAASAVVQRGELNVGLVGLSIPAAPLGYVPDAMPKGDELKDAAKALARELERVEAKGADLVVLLAAAPRGPVLRLIERADGAIQMAVLGKPFDQGDANDDPTAPEMIGSSLVMQAPNHLQGIGVVDLYVRGKDFSFVDGTGLSAHQEKLSLNLRIDELERRIARWEAAPGTVNDSDLKARKAELERLTQRRASLRPAKPPAEGSYFLYDLVPVREGLGEHPEVQSHLAAYFRRVNEHNKVAFADRKPKPAAKGEASYVGVDTCSTCHAPARAFWDTTQHGHAYETLSRDHKEFNLDCVGCHVTGYEKPGGSTVAHVEGLESVQCEVCHGPGSLHAGTADPSKITRVPERSLCASSCHHPPHVGPDWDVNIAWPQVLGPGHGQPLPMTKD